MTKGIAVYRLNYVGIGDGLSVTDHAENTRFIAIIDDEIWAIHADGQRERKGLQSEVGPFKVAGTRVNTISNLPDAVRQVIAERCEVLDGLKFEGDLTMEKLKGD